MHGITFEEKHFLRVMSTPQSSIVSCTIDLVKTKKNRIFLCHFIVRKGFIYFLTNKDIFIGNFKFSDI